MCLRRILDYWDFFFEEGEGEGEGSRREVLILFFCSFSLFRRDRRN